MSVKVVASVHSLTVDIKEIEDLLKMADLARPYTSVAPSQLVLDGEPEVIRVYFNDPDGKPTSMAMDFYEGRPYIWSNQDGEEIDVGEAILALLSRTGVRMELYDYGQLVTSDWREKAFLAAV